ncbi:OmpH family outer membrane protein [Roseovarius sp. SCSIO 43702]|uniref:OmpH family outer membrane protein n=1 Tax=Roseovarius sp. SCSIO 43702 TaxID=2823043 RepID=UPI001C7320F2|nr:OmpH family outer membrane protein [Roseovarius sp. SCSIO 43702]QYX58404.1 OmpH family outer membrane protein [Roseovarius sp. SCSIO 43702]
MGRTLRLALVLAAGLAGAAPVAAQDTGVVRSPILVLDTERLFTESEPGQQFIRRYTEQREALIARNREVEAELREEEQELTEKRESLSPEAFRDLADDFDDKVRRIREESERASRDLERTREQAPFMLLRQAEGVLFELMRETGGAVILDARQVLIRSDAVDITDTAIARIDEAMAEAEAADPGNGATGEEAPAEPSEAPPEE